MGACDEHLRRSWLLAALAGPLDRVRARIGELLALNDLDLVAAVSGIRATELGAEYRAFDHANAEEARRLAAAGGVDLICACAPEYPVSLRDLTSPPAVLHVVGDRFAAPFAAPESTVAIVGTRRASDAGAAVATALARGLAVSGLTVISGMAGGIDAAAHRGALAASAGSRAAGIADVGSRAAEIGDSASGDVETGDGRRGTGAAATTIAVLPAAPQRPYPAAARRLHGELVSHAGRGLAISELGPGVAVRPWMLVARNRIIAALATMTVVVEAPVRSGALITARFAQSLDRLLGAVPGPVMSRNAAGTNQLLRAGARLIRDVDDVLDDLCIPVNGKHARETRSPPGADEARLLEAVRAGADSIGKLLAGGRPPPATFAGLSSLELKGWLRLGVGGRISIVP